MVWLVNFFKPLNQLMKITTAYLDLSTDLIILYCIMNVLTLSIGEFLTFPCQIAFLLLASIVVPIFTSAIMTACKSPLVILSVHQAKYFNESFNRIGVAIVRAIIFMFFPFVPAMTILSAENAKEKRNSLKLKGYKKDNLIISSILDEYGYLTKYINETRQALLTFKRNELSMELIIQQSITLTMVLLSQTDFPLEFGLQAIFYEGGNSTATSPLFELIGIEETVKNFEIKHNITFWFLVFSSVWSLKTCALTAIKIKSETKNFLPLLPKITLGLKYLLIFSIRVGSIVTFFAPYIGLLGIMNHYQAETISLDSGTWMNFILSNDGHYHYWNQFEEQYQSIHISQLFRSNYTDPSDPQPPFSTKYTEISLGYAYLLFWLLFLMYAIFVTLVKYCINDDFKFASKGEKLQHIIEALNNPEAFQDWDSNLDLDVNGHLRKWSKIMIKMVVMCLLKVVSNLVMLVPFWITGKN